jgi:UDP-glucose 4-epimerase
VSRMEILVTGAAGFIGGHLLSELGDRHHLIGLDRQSRPAGQGWADWIGGDLSRPLESSALPGSIDAVIHLAQSLRHREFPDFAGDVFEVNVASTQRLLHYARGAGAGAFVLASSGSVYRSGEGLCEDDPLETGDFYALSKRMAEQLVDSYSPFLRASSLRLFFPYGPGPNRMLIARLTERVLAGDDIEIAGDPGLAMNPIYVSDAARAFAAALERGNGGAYNVAGEETVTLTGMVEIITEAARAELEIRHTDGDSASLVADITRMKTVLGVEPRVGLREGVAALLAGPTY